MSHGRRRYPLVAIQRNCHIQASWPEWQAGLRIRHARRGVVTRSSSYDRLAGAVRQHLDLPVAAIQFLDRGRVGNRVLVANVVRDLHGEGLHLGNILGIEGESAGGSGQFFQRTACLGGFALFLFREQTDGIDEDIALIGACHDLFERDVTGIIVAVRDHQQNLLVLLGFFVLVVERHAERVAHRSTAARIDPRQSLLHAMDVIRERNVQIRFIVEVDDEYFVLRIRFAHHGKRCGFHARALAHHAAAVVDDDAQ